jgi:hypothetical protein
MRICFTFHGRRICIDIPVLYNPVWQFGPGPVEGGQRVSDRGDFGEIINWVTVDGKAAEWGNELRALATIAALARRSPELHKGLEAGLRQTVAAIQTKLPEGATLHFDEHG